MKQDPQGLSGKLGAEWRNSWPSLPVLPVKQTMQSPIRRGALEKAFLAVAMVLRAGRMEST